MMKLILTTCIVLSFAVGLQAAPVKKLQISIDNQLVTFTSTPIFKNGVWLVPIESICQQLGLKIETPDGGEMVVICGEGEEADLCVPLQFGASAFDIDGVIYAKLENITEPFGFEIYKASETELEIVRPEQLAPQFTLPDLDGTPKRLQDFRGKKTLLYIWGSW
ncbi:MAG: redoxin domain-containing protein [Candidatus Poribacteria bacterium]|nr:redoxin domain-containing protein [Candidatus Poribacteria bacterium]